MNGITHRDIKPENIMFGSDNEIRLVDFGLSKDCKDHMSEQAGSHFYTAPEVFDGDYTHKCDIWSLACVLYNLTTGKQPFDCKPLKKETVLRKIKAGDFNLDNNMSKELNYLLHQMFEVDPQQRPTAKECQTHAWFKKLIPDVAETINNDDDTIALKIISKMRSFHRRDMLRSECLKLLVKMI